MVVKFVLFRLHNHCYSISVPISFDQGTEFIIVGVGVPLIVIRKSEVFDISNVSDH